MLSKAFYFLLSATIFTSTISGSIQGPPPPPPGTGPETAPASADPVAVEGVLDFSKEVDDSWHPHGAKEFGKAVGVSKIKYKKWPGLELYCDDAKVFKLLSPSLDKAWKAAVELLGESPLPPGMPLRVVVVTDSEALKAYWSIVNKGAMKFENTPPPESMFAGLLKAGSTRWNLPPTVILRPGAIPSSVAPTRAVHDVGVILAGWASSYSGYGGPEFLAEGFAGMLQRRSIKNPAAIVSHEQAALKETIHGYGVFAAIGAMMNDSSNSPNNWPRIIQNAVKSMLKKAQLEDAERIDALLLRTHDKFARADYGYAWATMEFLFDDQKVDEISRRDGLHRVLKTLKNPKDSAHGQLLRSQKFRELLLNEYNQTPAQLHEAFLIWVPKFLPKK
jgi:hypothetical protein